MLNILCLRMNLGKTSDKCMAILHLLVFLALCKIRRATAALLWFRAVLIFQATTFVHSLWFLEELIKVKLSDNILLTIKTLNINDLLVFLYNNLSISNRYYLIKGPRYSSPFIVHHWPSHDLLPSLEEHQRRQLLGQRRGTDPVSVQK